MTTIEKAREALADMLAMVEEYRRAGLFQGSEYVSRISSAQSVLAARAARKEG